MALYAFDGTGNEDQDDDLRDTNVVRFSELYSGINKPVYIPGVGTRYGALGRVLGGLLGAGGRSRITDTYEQLCQNWASGDQTIDIIGFSRGAALAVHFANKLSDEGIQLPDGITNQAEIRFLGLWDLVGSFGLSFDTIVNFQEINLGWNINTIHSTVQHCFHAMALDERRETFNVTRLNPKHELSNIEERWFRGVHSDVGGGNKNIKRSNIALQWMLEMAIASGVPINQNKALEVKYSQTDPAAPISENKDVQLDPRRAVLAGDSFHPTAESKYLEINQSQTILVLSRLKYNWSGIKVIQGHVYQFSFIKDDSWQDGDIECGPEGWTSNQLPGLKEFFVEKVEKLRRKADANWFELIGALGDNEDHLFRIGDGSQLYTATKDSELYLFANDLQGKYGNNDGSLKVTITRTS